MAPSAKVTLKMSHDNDAEQEEKSDWISLKRFASNATTRNMLDLLLVATIIVLLGIAAPVIRGDCKDNKLGGENSCKCNVRASCGTSDNRTSDKCICDLGFTGDGHNCKDIDECSFLNNSCPTHAHCINLVGSYTCECYHGYHGNHCNDVDECKLGIHLCDKHANCTNTIGSYKCACQAGFHDDGNSCKDVNECKAGSHNCSQDTRCLNIEGSYRCL